MQKKIVHLVPYDGIGGVETAARSMKNVQHEIIDFRVIYIFRAAVVSSQRWAAFIPLDLLSALSRLVSSHLDVLIVSLWRSAIVGILAKCLKPRLKLVVFIHDTVDAHWLDFILTRLAISFAHEVWADSHASLRQRFSNLTPGKCRIISFVTRRFEALPVREVSPDFIFWGRIHAKKGVDRALWIFAEILKQQSAARFWIIGPDGGVLRFMQHLCRSLGLTDKVFFLGEATIAEIVAHARNASFYIQASEYEGMAMSVVEAMQLGLVPVVTPVGEISSYCSHGVNSLIISSDRQIVADVVNLLNDNLNYQAMRVSAIAAWKDRELYHDSVLKACMELLASVKKVP